MSVLILAKVEPSKGDYTVYDGGFLRAPPGFQIDADSTKTDDQKKAQSEKDSKSPLAGQTDKGHYLTLIVGKGLTSKDSSELLKELLYLIVLSRISDL